MSRYWEALIKQAEGPHPSETVNPLQLDQYIDPAAAPGNIARFRSVVGDPRYTQRLLRIARSSPEGWEQVAQAASEFVDAVQQRALRGDPALAADKELLREADNAMGLIRQLLQGVPAGADVSRINPRHRQGVAPVMIPAPAVDPELPEPDIPPPTTLSPEEMAESVVEEGFKPQVTDIPGIGPIDLTEQRWINRLAEPSSPPDAGEFVRQTTRAPSSTDVRSTDVPDEFSIPELRKLFGEYYSDIATLRGDKPGTITHEESIFAGIDPDKPVSTPKPIGQTALELLEEQVPGGRDALTRHYEGLARDLVGKGVGAWKTFEDAVQDAWVRYYQNKGKELLGKGLKAWSGFQSRVSDALADAAVERLSRGESLRDLPGFEGLPEAAYLDPVLNAAIGTGEHPPLVAPEPSYPKAKPGTARALAHSLKDVAQRYISSAKDTAQGALQMLDNLSYIKNKGYLSSLDKKLQQAMEEAKKRQAMEEAASSTQAADAPWYTRLFDKLRGIDWSGAAKRYGPYALAGAGGLALGGLLTWLLNRGKKRRTELQPAKKRKSTRRRKKREKQSTSSYAAATANKVRKRQSEDEFEKALNRYAKDPTLDKARNVARVYRRRKRKKSAAQLVDAALSSWA